MMQHPPPPPDGIQSIINHKFFQGNHRIPNTTNPCAYQSIGQSQAGPYNQFPGALPYAYSYTQQPTTAVQQ